MNIFAVSYSEVIRISIVIATYNRGPQLMRTLGSFTRQTLPPEEWEVVVVANNCTDNTVELFAGFAGAHPQLNARIVEESRQGLSWARNKGIEQSRAPIIAIVDDDEEVNEEFAASYAGFFDRHPHAAAGGGRVVPIYDGGTPRWISRFTERSIAGTLDKGDTEKPFGGGYPAGGNMALRRSVFGKYGMFNTSLGRTGDNPIGGEEKELFHRLSLGGESVWYVPGAVIYHIIPAEKLTDEYFRRVARGCGESERFRTLSVSKGRYVAALVGELFKWAATFAIALWFTVSLQPLKARYLVTMRRYISAGLLCRK